MSFNEMNSEQKLPDSVKAELRRVLPSAIELARLAGEKIMSIYETDFQISNKKDNTPVTTADLEANALIVATLSALTPHIPILSEESDEIPYTERSTWETYWLVDPLDGTRAFIEKSGEFSVNIALIYRQQPVIGVVYSPVQKVGYYACKGSGAFQLNDVNESQPIQVCAQCTPVVGEQSRNIVVAGTRSARSSALQRFFANLDAEFNGREMKFLGSSLKSCLVAAGEADLYARLGPTSEWDTGAAQCIVEEAGGLITDTQMRPLRYNTKASLLNPEFFVFGDKSIPWNQFL
ncbi:3'(2'),5'-bisphosphate nucleotidase CysQ [sulfur-oxidizing endosymbiont of Gigantopelta aegis]|uniref:3'(2'),5'-bisphosphate nucleotidase CysQ n=1 Tax=sulfur-oxidizing endosymbiont of Gigantopelta aegis TaxID=2794934 RepID=UPI001FE8A9FF|nr:3'(2'),5'-bisphosphate nucleotidase CysQ [sulfur-oxidizing endosymbiont of Gigantopelta aegis]